MFCIRGTSRQIRRGEAGVPVVNVKNVRDPAGIGAARELRRDPAEEPEAAMIVGPVAAVRARIGIAWPVVERRLVDQISEKFRPRHPGETYSHPLRGEGLLQPGGIGNAVKRIEKACEAGQQQARINAKRDQCRRQRGGDIAKPAGLHPGVKLGGNVQDAQRRL